MCLQAVFDFLVFDDSLRKIRPRPMKKPLEMLKYLQSAGKFWSYFYHKILSINTLKCEFKNMHLAPKPIPVPWFHEFSVKLMSSFFSFNRDVVFTMIQANKFPHKLLAFCITI